MKYNLSSLHCELSIVHCSLCSVHCALCSVQCALCSIEFAVPCILSAVCSVQCPFHSVQCAVCSVQCAVCTVPAPAQHQLTEHLARRVLGAAGVCTVARLQARQCTVYIIPQPGNLHKGNICQCYPCRSRAVWRQTGCSIMSVSHTPN